MYCFLLAHLYLDVIDEPETRLSEFWHRYWHWRKSGARDVWSFEMSSTGIPKSHKPQSEAVWRRCCYLPSWYPQVWCTSRMRGPQNRFESGGVVADGYFGQVSDYSPWLSMVIQPLNRHHLNMCNLIHHVPSRCWTFKPVALQSGEIIQSWSKDVLTGDGSNRDVHRMF